jgi:hypothetical protein
MSTKLKDFQSPPWETSLYKNIPISKYTPEKVQVIREIVGRPIRIRFRGPRNTIADKGRTMNNRQSSCLKESDKTFTVYVR